jgi:uncharacterized protein
MSTDPFPLDEDWLELLACPVCRGPLQALREPDRLRCAACDHDYPIQDGIPDLVPPDGDAPVS